MIADRDRQTILVALEDRVRVTTMINGVPGSVQEWQVGASSGAVDANAVRRAQLAWTIQVGNDSAVPDVIADRLSEDWAQARIYFRNMGSTSTLDVGGIRSVLSIRHERRRTNTSSGGIIEFDVLNDQTGALLDHISQPYGPNTQILTFARLIESELQTRGYAVEYILGPLRKHGERLLALEPTQPRRVANFQTSGEVKVDQYEVEIEDAETPDFQIMALHAKDADDQTIDVVATDARRLGSDRLGATIYGGSRFGNTIFLTRQAADQEDDFAMVAGHEAGHAFLSNQIPGGIPGNESHHPDSRNLMDKDESGERMNGGRPFETIDGSKRLTSAQHVHARCMSGTTSDRATLACPLGSDPSGPVLLLPLGRSQ